MTRYDTVGVLCQTRSYLGDGQRYKRKEMPSDLSAEEAGSGFRDDAALRDREHAQLRLRLVAGLENAGARDIEIANA